MIKSLADFLLETILRLTNKNMKVKLDFKVCLNPKFWNSRFVMLIKEKNIKPVQYVIAESGFWSIKRILDFINNNIRQFELGAENRLEQHTLFTLFYNKTDYIYIYNYLLQDIPWEECDYCYISVRDIKKILDTYIEEYKKYEKEESKYEEKLKKMKDKRINEPFSEVEIELEDEIEWGFKVVE